MDTVEAKALTVPAAAPREVAATVEMVIIEAAVEAAVKRVVAVVKERNVKRAVWKDQQIHRLSSYLCQAFPLCQELPLCLEFPCPGLPLCLEFPCLGLLDLLIQGPWIKYLITFQLVGTVLEWQWEILVNSLWMSCNKAQGVLPDIALDQQVSLVNRGTDSGVLCSDIHVVPGWKESKQ